MTGEPRTDAGSVPVATAGLTQLLRHLSDRLYLFDDRRRIWYTNESRGAAGQHLDELLGPEAAAVIAGAAHQARTTGEPVPIRFRHDHRHPAEAGLVLPLNLPEGTITALLLPRPRTATVVASVGGDDREPATPAWLRGTLHDVNNLLQAAALILDGLVWRLDPDDEPISRSWLREELAHLKELLQRIGRLSRSASRSLRRRSLVRPEAFDLNELIRELEPLLRRVLGGKIELLLDLHSGPTPVFAHPGHLEQVLWNLVLNARDAHRGPGVIELVTREVDTSATSLTVDLPAERCILLAVGDTGSGIAPELLAEIFDPLFSSKEEASGLGLPHVVRLLGEHGALLEVQSYPGAGTTFRLYFPCARSSREPAAEPPVGALARLH